MKRLLIIPILALFYAAPAFAGSGVATQQTPYSETQTGTAVTASFTATSKNQGYTLTVYSAAGDFQCRQDLAPTFSAIGPRTPVSGPQTMTCSMPAGTWVASFSITKGPSVPVTLTWG